MRLRNNNEAFYATPYGIAKDLIQFKTNNFTTDPGFTAAQVQEVGAQLIAHTKLTGLTNNVTSYQMAFEFLERKVEVARKTISFWDAYQIKGILVEGEEDLLTSKIAQLPSNSSIIANTRGDWYEDGQQQSYYPGDIFVKDYYNRITHIPIISTGYYYPSSITPATGNTYNIVYTYASSEPAYDTEQEGIPAKQMTFNVDPSNEDAYNMSYILAAGATSPQFSAIINQGNIVYPVIKAFINNSGTLEEQIFNGIKINYNSNNFTIKNETQSEIIVTVK